MASPHLSWEKCVEKEDEERHQISLEYKNYGGSLYFPNENQNGDERLCKLHMEEKKVKLLKLQLLRKILKIHKWSILCLWNISLETLWGWLI